MVTAQECSPLVPDSSLGVWFTLSIKQTLVLMSALAPTALPQSESQCGAPDSRGLARGRECSAAQRVCREGSTPGQNGQSCACASHKPVSLQALERPGIMVVVLQSRGCKATPPRSKQHPSHTTSPHIPGPVPPGATRCLKFISGDQAICAPSLSPEEQPQGIALSF